MGQVAAQQLVDGKVDTVQDVNVTTVQTILTTTFGQRIHGPPGHGPPPPPPGPHPQYYNVSGAGSEIWNGHYVYTGSDMYVSTNPQCPQDQPCALYPYGGVWRLAADGKELFYVASQVQSLVIV